MTDIVDRLLNETTVSSGPVTPLRRQAASEIEFLRAQMDAMRELLPPANPGALRRRMEALEASPKPWCIGDEIEVQWFTSDPSPAGWEPRPIWRKAQVTGLNPLTVRYQSSGVLHSLNAEISTRRPIPKDDWHAV